MSYPRRVSISYTLYWGLILNEYIKRKPQPKVLKCRPVNITPLSHEKAVSDPMPILNLPPLTYCKVANPIQLDDKVKPVTSEITEENGESHQWVLWTAIEKPQSRKRSG